MSNANLTVGSQFTTQKSGVSGIIQEIVQNKNGTRRVRLSVNGQDRWTTVKQFSWFWWGSGSPSSATPPKLSDPISIIRLIKQKEEK